MGRIAGRFGRVEPRRRVRAFVLGLLSDLPRKNCWTLAEHSGDASPYGLQHLLSRARWDADAVRDDIRGFVVENLHHQDAVLVVDETGDLKKGMHTVGVQRQYTGTAGRIENSQVAATSPTPPRSGTRRSTVSCMSRVLGPRMRPAAGPPGSPMPSASPRNLPSPPA
jgi:SRSO17 transposase